MKNLDLLAHLLGKKRGGLLLEPEIILSEAMSAKLQELERREAEGEPLAYLLGSLDFFGAHLKIDRRALIPRQETEILVEEIAKRIRGPILWDLCTGSGCIGIALKKRFPHLEVTLADICPDALSLARENAAQNGVNLFLKEGDFLTPFAGERADAVVVNPPYVSLQEFCALDPSVKDFEPSKALLGGEDGLDFYRRLAGELATYLKPGGQLFLEIGASQGADVQKIFESCPWTRQELLKDWAGKDRFFFLEKEV